MYEKLREEDSFTAHNIRYGILKPVIIIKTINITVRKTTNICLVCSYLLKYLSIDG